MKAVQIRTTGSTDVLEYLDLPVPQPGPGQIRIKVESASVNFADVQRRRGELYPFPTPMPFIPGSEVAGTVDAQGEDVTNPAIGTSVFALAGRGGDGGYAQYALADASGVIPIPPGMNFDMATSLIVAGSTATLLLTEVTQLQPGESVLVPAATGGVGTYAIQIAKLLGAVPIIAAAGSSEKQAAARRLGATDTVDYAQSGWTDDVREITGGRGINVVLEMTGGHVFEQSLNCLAPFGRLAVYGRASGTSLQFGAHTIDHVFYAPSPNQSIINFNLGLWFGRRPETAVEALRKLIGWVLAGDIQVQVGQVFPLSHAGEAHRLLEERRAIGKIVLKPWA